MTRTKRLTKQQAQANAEAMTDAQLIAAIATQKELMPIITRGSSAVASDNLFMTLDALNAEKRNRGI